MSWREEGRKTGGGEGEDDDEGGSDLGGLHLLHLCWHW